jgi:hypothetical protein
MTMPYVRTRAVLRAKDLLMDLAGAPDDLDVELFRGRARTLLRHCPEKSDIHISAALAPSIWADPAAKWYE